MKTRAVRELSFACVALAVAAGAEFQAGAARAGYDAAATATWRAEKEADLQKPDGWLTVAGLHFLEPGESTIGTDVKNEIVMPAGSGPARAGRVRVSGGRVTVSLERGVQAQLNGQPVSAGADDATATIELRDAARAEKRPADRLTIGRAVVHLHHSGERLALRVRDPESPLRRDFAGLRWFDIDAAWAIEGKFIPFDAPKTFPIQNVLGDIDDSESPGLVEATIAGRTVRLLALKASEGRLWFVFSDATAGETYRIRFLYAAAPENGRVLLDFNKAYNPPCAYNPHTTCPLPPSQNRMTVRVTAGELAYAGHASKPDSPATQSARGM